MDMEWLGDVLVLLEEGNMTRAAARRNITQPAFSRRIRNFENWLGTPVLDRGTNSVGISPALLSNEAELRALVTRLRDLRAKIAHFDPASSTVSVAAQHAQMFSRFPDMALKAKQHFPALKFRLRAANLRDCVTMFLRGDTSMLVSYEAETTGPLPFGSSIRRELCGKDYLVPVAGGSLRFAVRDDGDISEDTPAIVYPDNSYFGEILNKGERAFGTHGFSANPVCVTAFSNGIKELALKGIGIGWLPYSMVHREVESGELLSLGNRFGKERLDVVVYADTGNEMATALLDIWKLRGA